jgi:4-hydroxybenzoate polyprenyltransferase/phosphoserine phosphatase
MTDAGADVMNQPTIDGDRSSARPLYIDLDGTLVCVDTLAEALVRQVTHAPLSIFRMAVELARGRAALKVWVAGQRVPDVAALPYRDEVVAMARDARASGRRVVLATAAHESWARVVADHVGLFDDVFGSTREINLKGAAKLDRIQRDANGLDFEYAGDSRADLPIFAAAARSVVVGGNRSLVRAARRVSSDVVTMGTTPKLGRVLLRAMRPHQWMKNVLILVPALLAHAVMTPTLVRHLALAVVTFSLVASSVYVINDLVDIDSDRGHPTKSRRPLASGALPLHYAPLLILFLLSLGLGTSVAFLPGGYTSMLGGYLGLNLLYSLWLKRKLLVDVLLLSGLYTWRILAGGVAAEVPVSEWLLAMSVFGFTSLALVKRYVELIQSGPDQAELRGRGYTSEDLESVGAFGATSGFMAVLVLALYINSDTVRGLYAQPDLLWLACPILMYWFARIWFLARRGQVQDDPLVFVIRDRVSLFAIALLAVVASLASRGL